MPEGEVEVEAEMSHAAADVIFRTLFSIPIEHEVARAVFHAVPRPSAQPADPEPCGLSAACRAGCRAFTGGRRCATAREIRALIDGLTAARAAEIAAGHGAG